jgi:hypothetical protein
MVVVPVCQLPHYKTDQQLLQEHFSPKFSQLDAIEGVKHPCDSQYCVARSKNQFCSFQVFAATDVSNEIYKLCSLKCVLDKMAKCSPNAISKKHKRLAKKEDDESEADTDNEDDLI